ncbi:unnamed protein product [Ceratitis capitata]|uniref:(Mediterranean fruit fly) hypothetical protein n=1 Tax=Ceratitis capitata TaxID=7213 RepID=A0A811UN54_CERCA|nr:unnamed protein product [Ceratitis capitata]
MDHHAVLRFTHNRDLFTFQQSDLANILAVAKHTHERKSSNYDNDIFAASTPFNTTKTPHISVYLSCSNQLKNLIICVHCAIDGNQFPMRCPLQHTLPDPGESPYMIFL